MRAFSFFTILVAAAIFGCIPLVAIAATTAPASPRIAVWNPVNGTVESRLTINPADGSRLVQWMAAGGVRATLLTADQIADAKTFSSQTFDGIVFNGNAFPHSDLDALKKFAGNGGVLMDFGADVPFLITIAPGPDGKWVLDPAKPKFAWQTYDILKMLGLRYVYQPALFDQGVWHPSTLLFKRYLPKAIDLRGKLPSRWVVPMKGKDEAGEIYPLIRSERRDIAAVPPQIYVVRHGDATAIVSTNPMYTSNSDTKMWPMGEPTVVALARLAKDLHDHALKLTPAMETHIQWLPPQASEPLDRVARSSVNPEHAQPVIRWGKFDGSDDELGPKLPAGEKISVAATDGPKKFPRMLGPGASVQLELPELGNGPMYLRIRGAYTATGAGLKATLGSEVVYDEKFIYIDASSPGNFSRGLIGLPAEFMRLVYLSADALGAKSLVLSNPGNEPIYFDAVQIERRSQPSPSRMVCMNAPNGHVPTNLSKTWTGVRMSLRTNFLGEPGDPHRWDKMDKLFNRTASLGAPIQAILEGTPPWAAISAERLAEAIKAKRPRTVPPDPIKYAQIVRDVITHFGSRISTYEIWNEADITQFYRGSPAEYLKLFKTIVPIIHEMQPKAPVIMCGMSGYRENFLQDALTSGALNITDLIAFHPYTGKSDGWDMPYGLLQGTLMSDGIDTEIYCNESGFPWKNAEWFKAPPKFTPQLQKRMLSVAMGRLLANGLAKIAIFNAGGDENPYGLINGHGHPRPAYSVFADYTSLGQPGGTRLDISTLAASGMPLQGIYTAATRYDDGSVAIVINPAQCSALSADDSKPLSIQIRMPITKPLAAEGTISDEKHETKVAVQSHDSPNGGWAELTIPVRELCVVRIAAK